MRRALFWAGVALTIALVAFGIWYYVRDDYPFQLSPDQIAGLSYHSVAAPGSGAASVSGYISEPPPDLADWVSSMEKDSSDETVTVTTVATGGADRRASVAPLPRWLTGLRTLGRARRGPVDAGRRAVEPALRVVPAGRGRRSGREPELRAPAGADHHACVDDADADVGLGVADALAGRRAGRRRPGLRASYMHGARPAAGVRHVARRR